MKKKNIVIATLLLLVVALLCACGAESTKGAAFYDDATIIDFGSGKTSVVLIESTELDLQSIEEWYVQHYLPGGYSYSVVIYGDGSTGVWASGDMVEVGVPLSKSDDGSYEASGEGVLYLFKDGKLKLIAEAPG